MKRWPAIQNASKTKCVKQKIFIIGDSHARNSAAELQHWLGSTFTEPSFVKPGAGMKTIVDTAKEDIMKFTGDDVVVIWGGTNDIGKDNSREAMKHLGNFVMNNQMVFMDDIKPALTVSQIVKVKELVNSTKTQDLDNATDHKLNNLSTVVPSKSKPKIKLSYHSNGLVPFTIYHQNVRGKAIESLSQLHPNFPHVLCLSEHHMNHLELQQTFIDNYKLGVSYCRTLYEKGGLCIFVQEIDMDKHCKDKDFEVCAIKIYFNAKSACIIAIYRAPSGNFDVLISKLDTVLRNCILLPLNTLSVVT